MRRLALIYLVLCGCEFAFPLVLDADIEEAEIKDSTGDSLPNDGAVVEDRRDAATWDHKNGS